MYSDNEIAIAFALDVMREKVAHVDVDEAVARLQAASDEDNAEDTIVANAA